MPLRIIKLSYKYLLLPIVTISRIIIIIGIAIATLITSAITIFMLGELYNYVHIYICLNLMRSCYLEGTLYNFIPVLMILS